MDRDSVLSVLTRVDEMRVSLSEIARIIGEESIPQADQRYLSRCCDLLGIELTAMREYVERLE